MANRKYLDGGGREIRMNMPYIGGSAGTAFYTYFEEEDGEIIRHELVGFQDIETRVSDPEGTRLEGLIPVVDPEMNIREFESWAGFLRKALGLEKKVEASIPSSDS